MKFRDMFKWQHGKPTGFDKAHATSLFKLWIKDDNDSRFIDFVRYIEKQILPFNKEMYCRVIDTIVRLCNTYTYLIDSSSPLYFEYQRLKWKNLQYHGDVGLEKKHSIIIDYLRILLNLRDNKHIKFYLEIGQLDREIEVEQVIFDGSKIHALFRSEHGFNYLRIIIRWFLNRYNLATAAKLMRFHSSISQKWGKLGLWAIGIALALCTASMVIEMILGTYWGGGFFFEWMQRFSCGPSIPWTSVPQNLISLLHLQNSVSATLLFLLYALIIILIVIRMVVVLWQWIRKSKKPELKAHWLTLLVPRLFAGILVGYLPLLFATDAWQFAFHLQFFPTIILCIGSLGLCLLYLNTEITNHIPDVPNRKWRVLRVFTIGLVESLLMGVIITDLIALPTLTTLLPEIDQPINAFYGLFGLIIPKIVLVFFPLALLIGIFAQLIWEDKPVTQPL
ncbi:hypothetical protein H8E88_12245 [candidate division KSB1 bacterium]|nr:hypothetical protein [candidate division KSB1 bacterium]